MKTFAGGNDVSAQLLDLGHPDFIAEYIRAAGVSYAQVTDAYAVTGLLAAATDVTSLVGASLTDVIAGLFAALDPAVTPAGSLFMLVSNDLAASAAALKGSDETPVFWSGSISLNGFMPEVDAGGLAIAVDPNMPTGTALMGYAGGATWFAPAGVPYSLDVWNVNLLGRDIGVYGYGALGVTHPGALVKTTVPAGP